MENFEFKEKSVSKEMIKSIIDEKLAIDDLEIENMLLTIHVEVFSKFIQGALWDPEATYPTISDIHKKLMELEELLQWSESTTYKVLTEMGFKWIQDHVIDYAAIIERVEIREWRKIFLNKMKQYREEGNIFFMQDRE